MSDFMYVWVYCGGVCAAAGLFALIVGLIENDSEVIRRGSLIILAGTLLPLTVVALVILVLYHFVHRVVVAWMEP